MVTSVGIHRRGRRRATRMMRWVGIGLGFVGLTMFALVVGFMVALAALALR